MKRPFALIGFTSFAVLLFLNLFFKVHTAFAVMIISVMAGVVLLFTKKYRQALVLPVFLFTAAFACFLFICSDTDKATAQSLAGDNVNIEATVSESPYFRKDRGRYYCILRLKKIGGQTAKGKLRLSFSYEGDGINPEELLIGNNVSFTAKVYIPGENEEDISRYFTGEKIYLGAYGAKNFSSTAPRYRNIEFYFSHIRKFVSARLSYGFPDKVSGLLIGLLTGDKSHLDSNLYKSFRVSGIAHLLAVSGVHLSIWVFVIGSVIPENRKTSKFKYILLLIIVAFIMFLAGMSESVKRAGFMSAVFLIGKLSGRKSDSLNSLGFSVFIMLLLNPACVLSTSLQLSFLSTLSILTLGKAMMKKGRQFSAVKRLNPFLRKLAAACSDSVFISISVLIFTFPVLIYSFGGISSVTVLSNILMLPLITPLLFLSGIYVIFSKVSFIAYPVCVIVKILADFAILAAENCAKIKNAFLPFERDYVLLYITAMIIISWFVLIVLKNNLKGKAASGLAVLIICTCLVTAYERDKAGQLNLHFLNINGHLITAVEKHGKAVLYSEASAYEKSIALSSLQEKGVDVTHLLTVSDGELCLLDAENGKIADKGEGVTLRSGLILAQKDGFIQLTAYGKYIRIFHSQPLQYNDTCDIISVSQSASRDKLLLFSESDCFYSDENKGFKLTLTEEGNITLRGENSWQNLMKKA